MTAVRGTRRRSTTQSVWGPDDLVRWLGANLIGAVLVGVGWYLAAGQGFFDKQFGPADLAIAGAIVLGVGNGIWILRGRRAVGERLRNLILELDLATAHALSAPIERVPQGRVDGVTDWLDLDHSPALPIELVGADGMQYFHRADCRMVRERSWPAQSLAQHLSAGRAPCPICAP